MILLATYDIGNDRRREEVSRLLEACGARVQFSVFECQIPSAETLQHLRTQILQTIDENEDQVRFYVLESSADVDILGNRTLQERQAFWIL